MVNYVPGYAYAWNIVWAVGFIVLSSFAIARRHGALFAAAAISFVYWLVWLLIPIVGYAWFFAWHFVDNVVAQEEIFEEQRRPPFADESAKALASPFHATVYLGLICWVGGFVLGGAQLADHYRRVRSDPEYRQTALIAHSAAQAQQRQRNAAIASMFTRAAGATTAPTQQGDTSLV